MAAGEFSLPTHHCPAKSLSSWTLPTAPHQWDVGIVSSFALFVPPRIITAFSRGMINIHPSLLPQYRGPAPIQYAIMRGDSTTGVSIIDLHPTTIDAGNILIQNAISVPTNSWYRDLEARLAQHGGELVASVCANFDVFWQNRRPQTDHRGDAVIGTRKIASDSGMLILQHMTALDAGRIIRAVSHQTPIKTRLVRDGRTVILEDLVLGGPRLDGPAGSVVYSKHDRTLYMQTADGVIGAKRLKMEGKSSIFPAGAFFANFVKQDGTRFFV